MAEPAAAVLAALAGYLLGTVPSARWVAGRRGVDPAAAGEGNPGAANVWRLLGPRAGLAVFALDAGKSALAGVAGLSLGGWWAACAGVVGAMAGHAFPVWHRFRGGRAVACLAAGGVVLAPLPGALGWLAFLVAMPGLGLARAAGGALLAYPVLFALLVPDRRRLIGVGAAYMVLLGARRGLPTRGGPGRRG